jgi:UPF0716 protein FxsA
MWLLLAFVLVPMIEIGLFIQVGGVIGLWPTLAIVFLTAIAGSYMVKSEGLKTLRDLQQSMNQMSDPSQHLAHGAMILFAGALLLTPGFFTDTVGLLLLIPGVRTAVFKKMRGRMKMQTFHASSHGGHYHRSGPGSDTIDVDYEVIDETRPKEDRPEGPSGWTRH